jgi:hypothetical protein
MPMKARCVFACVPAIGRAPSCSPVPALLLVSQAAKQSKEKLSAETKHQRRPRKQTRNQIRTTEAGGAMKTHKDTDNFLSR